MAEEYCRGVLRVCLAQISQNLGWHATQSTPLELLTDVLERYIVQLGNVTHRYSEQFGRTQPTVDDVAVAFHQLGINLSELEEYVHHVEPLPFAHDVVAFPAPKQCNLRFPKPGSKELLTREDHIPDYLPLMYPTPEDEVEADQEGHFETAEPVVPPSESAPAPESVSDVVSPQSGEKRSLTSPQDAMPMKKRIRLVSSCLPEEAAHSQYEMKAIIITTTGDLTPTKGGKLPDARTPPSGFSASRYDREHFTMKPSEPKVAPIKVEKELSLTVAYEKPKAKATEEILIYPDGSSKKLPKSKAVDEEYIPKESFKKKPVIHGSHKTSKLWTPNATKQKKKVGRPVGRPRSRSKSPRVGSKSPSRAKSPAQAGSPRGRGRPPKDKSLQKTPEKKTSLRVQYTAPTVEEIFTGEGVLDLSVSTKKKAEETPTVSAVTVKEEDFTDTSKPIDLSKSKEAVSPNMSQKSVSSEMSPTPIPRPRGRPPISPEKKRARELAIAESINAVIDRNKEELEREEKEGKDTGSAGEVADESEKTMDELSSPEKIAETEAFILKKEKSKETPAAERLDVPYMAKVKSEPSEQMSPSQTVSEVKKKRKNKEKGEEQVKEKLKEKIKQKDSEIGEVKEEPIEEQALQPKEKSSQVFDFPVSPSMKKADDIKTEPLKQFTVEIPEGSRDGDGVREKSKDREKSKEHKKDKKEKKEKKKKKDKDRDREKDKKKAKSKDYPSEYPTVSKLKIKLGSKPSANIVNVMEEPKASPIHEIISSPRDSPSSRPELKLVIKALPPLASQEKDSPSSTPKHSHKEKEKSKKDNKEKKEKKLQQEKEQKEKEQREKEQREKEEKEMIIREAEVQRLQEIREKERREEEEREKLQKEKEMKEQKEREFQEKVKWEMILAQKKEKEEWEEIRKNTPPPVKKEQAEDPPVHTPQVPPRVLTPVPVSNPKSPSPDQEATRLRFTPSPSPSSQDTRKTFTPSPSPSNSVHNSPSVSPDRSRRDSQSQSPSRSKSRSQSPVHTPSPSHTASPVPSPIPSPPPSRPSVSPTPTKPPTPSASPDHSPTPSPKPSVPREVPSLPPMPPPSIGAGPASKPAVQRTVIAETVTTFIDETGSKIWICPACKMPDDGSPMIGCDICDDWYHWPCVNLKESPPEDEPWYCVRCMPNKQKTAKRGRGRGRGRGAGRGRKKSQL
ncbi:hypothetical protein FSP39_010746 [Pinctada imbricata]|uniref:PHD-type domain-containing protein n=1 Tax=Pinctada imbricata TaxID=66713 RepID=A0AA88YBQ8_PINIB|nr:hypothetical protein FSP39_010746 [Pinctada imbricata]